MKSRSRLLALALLGGVFLALPVRAADDEADLKRRVELAAKMVEVLPVRPQVESAVESYVNGNMATYTAEERDVIRRALLNVINPQALEKATLDAYASVYTAPELEAMIGYYSLPEAQSAAKKQKQFSGLIYPEIMKMLDEGIMRMRAAAEKANAAKQVPATPPSPPAQGQ